MKEILILASILAPVITAFFQLAKKVFPIRKNLIPLAALIIGLGIGALATPFTDLDLIYRLWAGAFGGLSAVGLFEIGHQTIKGEDK